ncbi:MAG: sensor domain-containing diguanylate cyclase [Zoogloeaceae bacterium]|jgi:diguanylate cyclase (GGDEF)-like protein|nr:sensor domain-containing diguanylate cyclase [Zoogloeaceae bacterium]
MLFKSKKTLSVKVSIFFVVVSAAMVVLLAGVSLYAFRAFSISAATGHLRTAAEIVRVHLTDSMITGVIDQRQQFLQRVTEVEGLRTIRVVRSPLVDSQFGKSNKGEYLPDAIENQVMQSGKAYFGVQEKDGETIFQGTIPYIATIDGVPNCLMCHQSAAGSVLGVITLTMSLTSLRHNAIITVICIVAIVILAILLLFALSRYHLQPISNTAAAVEKVVREAINGNFKGTVDPQTDDEIGQIADSVNRLLRFLDTGLSRIGNHVAQLTDRKPELGENQLSATIAMVEVLTQISHYKLAIEEDDTKIDVYRRLIGAIQEKFGAVEHSIYEISPDKNEIRPIIVDGELHASCRWCDAQILTKPGSCRVYHTGHRINGLVQPDICYSFKQNGGDDETRRYTLCFPILQSGAVGSIIQLVVREEKREHYLSVLPYINAYLRETAPVLEARRLLESLKESTLRDPMTGLNNRRFLEEYIDTLVANVKRKQSPLAVMMLDLDHFKMVNDTYGHDAGDTVLKELAQLIKHTVRTSDIVVRYGGEEFLVILQDTSGETAETVAENIRQAVEKMRINYGGIVLQKTISIGLADFPLDSNTFWQTVKFADVALYHAKEAGRNRVVRFSPEMWMEQEY